MAETARYSRAWVALWVASCAALLALVPALGVWHWLTVALVLFGVPEVIGLLRRDDAFPPLTFVLRRYVPRWLTHTAVSGAWGAVSAYWLGFPRPWAVGALLALYGWLGDHFDVTYDD